MSVLGWHANLSFIQTPTHVYDDDTSTTVFNRMKKGAFRRGGKFWIYEDFNATFSHGEYITFSLIHYTYDMEVHTKHFSIRYNPTQRYRIKEPSTLATNTST